MPTFPITPPRASIRRELSAYIRKLYKNNPLTFIALSITIVGLLWVGGRNLYFSLAGPNFRAIVEFREPIQSNTIGELQLSIENYSDIPVQGLKVTILPPPDSLINDIEKTSIVIGSIPAKSASPKERISFLTHRLGKGVLRILLEPLNSESNVRSSIEQFAFEIRHS